MLWRESLDCMLNCGALEKESLIVDLPNGLAHIGASPADLEEAS